MQQIVIPGPDGVRKVRAFTHLRDCEPEGSVKFTRTDSLISSRGCGPRGQVVIRLSSPIGSGAATEVCVGRWRLPVSKGRGARRSRRTSSIPTALRRNSGPHGETRGWATSAADRRPNRTSLGILPSDVTGNWSDPLLPIPFVNDTIWYGAPPYAYENPRIGFIPFQGNLLGIPLVTVSEERGDEG